MKKSIPTSLKDEIDWTINKIISKIKFEAKLHGLNTVDNWRDLVSEEALDPLSDVEVAEENKNIYNFGTAETQKLTHIVEQLYPGKKVESSGSFLYPETGFMGWHTNSDSPCTRLYITHSDGESFFRYLNEDNEVITDYDDKGITIREFNIPKPPKKLWHCIGSNCNRYSFGFRIF